jgi:hypothetical protein
MFYIFLIPIKKIYSHPEILEYAFGTYLVEISNGDLLLLRRFFETYLAGGQGMSDYFRVHKLVLDDESGSVVERVEINNIGDDALFVGDNQSICISTSDFPDCKPNSIYYTDDYVIAHPYIPDGPIDMGIFNLEDGSTKRHYKPNPAHKKLPPPPPPPPPPLFGFCRLYKLQGK